MWISRRCFLQTAGAGFGSLALRDLIASDTGNLRPHHTAQADAVIFLFMYGGPSQVDTFDPKPTLSEWAGKPIPTYRKEDSFFTDETKPTAFPSPYAFAQYGASGQWISEKYPHLSKHADELCILRGMHADSNNHGPALSQMNSGFILQGYPSMGSWITYALGNATQNLPSYVVLLDKQGAPVNGAINWSNGFMPAAFQGVPFRPSGPPIVNLANPEGVTDSRQRARLDLIRQFNRDYALSDPGAGDLEARIASYELASRMQTHAPEVTDLTSEPDSIKRAYGLDQKPTAHFGRNCLLARRLVERGVRFVQLYSGGNRGPEAWDAHDKLKENHDRQCAETDQPIAALLQDLKQRGMLGRTLVVWGGEFGRMPTHQGSAGRDHNPFGFTMWMTGGGISPGTSYGETDEFGYRAALDKVHVHDLHATILHLLGIDHEKLTFRHNSRDFRLTDVHGEVISKILA